MSTISAGGQKALPIAVFVIVVVPSSGGFFFLTPSHVDKCPGQFVEIYGVLKFTPNTNAPQLGHG
jgi:hypothetical protein